MSEIAMLRAVLPVQHDTSCTYSELTGRQFLPRHILTCVF